MCYMCVIVRRNTTSYLNLISAEFKKNYYSISNYKVRMAWTDGKELKYVDILGKHAHWMYEYYALYNFIWLLKKMNAIIKYAIYQS